MSRIITAIFFLGYLLTASAETDLPIVRLITNHGVIGIELYEEKAPETVASFLEYVDSGFYTDTLFHRIIDNFMIQGGGYSIDYQKKDTRPSTRNESGNRLSNKLGTIAMARTGDPHSATSQFFINVKNNSFLDFQMQETGLVNTVRQSQLGIQDAVSGKLTTNDCRGNPIRRDTLNLAASSDDNNDGYICLMQAILHDNNYSLNSALEECLMNFDKLKQAEEIKPDGTCSEYINSRHAALKPVYIKWGYTVFGKVVQGMDIVTQLQSVPTGANDLFSQDAPISPVIIQSIERVPNQ